MKVFGIDVASHKDKWALILNPKLMLTDSDSLDWEVCDPNSESPRHQMINKYIKHAYRLGKRLFDKPELAVRELRYAKLYFIFTTKECVISKYRLMIPIPYMNNDHRVSIFLRTIIRKPFREIHLRWRIR